ncbi:TPA: tyrosine-type recombinase/integrase [Vibrio harveyi]
MKHKKFHVAKRNYRNFLNKKGVSNVDIKVIINKIDTFFRLTDKDPFRLSAEEAINMYSRLYEMPKFLYQKKCLKDYCGDELILKSKELGFENISLATAEQYLGEVNRFFEWCVSLGLLDRNCFSMLSAKKNTVKNNRQRESYTEEQLHELLKVSVTDWTKISDLGWILIIAIELGMRQNEISQLHKLNVVKVDGVHCISVNDRLPLQSIKNKYSERHLPITKSMIRLGFLNFVESKNDMLFEGLTYCEKNKYSRKVSEHYSRINRSLFDNEKLTFHSIRHYFVDKLKKKDLPEDVVAEINGREHNKETFGRYGKDRPIKYKQKILDKHGSLTVARYARRVFLNNIIKGFKVKLVSVY